MTESTLYYLVAIGTVLNAVAMISDYKMFKKIRAQGQSKHTMARLLEVLKPLPRTVSIINDEKRAAYGITKHLTHIHIETAHADDAELPSYPGEPGGFVNMRHIMLWRPLLHLRPWFATRFLTTHPIDRTIDHDITFRTDPGRPTVFAFMKGLEFARKTGQLYPSDDELLSVIDGITHGQRHNPEKDD